MGAMCMCWVKRYWKRFVVAAAFTAWVLLAPLIADAVSKAVPGLGRIVEAFALKGLWR